jgi:DNA-binding NarL/FixJ family response regulator
MQYSRWRVQSIRRLWMCADSLGMTLPPELAAQLGQDSAAAPPGTTPLLAPGSLGTQAGPGPIAPDTVHQGGSGCRVLIVDDVASTRRFLRAVLEDCCWLEVVGEADNGKSAVERAETLQPDVVLLDLSMPELDGHGALGEILRVAPRTKVVILSGGDANLGDSLVGSGATAFLPKGLPPWDLAGRLEIILERPFVISNRQSTDPLPLAEPIGRSARTKVPRAKGEFQSGNGYSGEETLGRGRPRAVVCDSNPTTRHLVAEVIESYRLRVVAELVDTATLLSVIGPLQPQLVVFDPCVKGEANGDAIAELRGQLPSAALVVYSAMEDLKKQALFADAPFVIKPHLGQLAECVRHFSRDRANGR